MELYRGDILAPHKNALGAHKPSPGYYVDVDGEPYWDLANFNAAEEPLEPTVLKANFCSYKTRRRADVFASSFIIDVVDSAVEDI